MTFECPKIFVRSSYTEKQYVGPDAPTWCIAHFRHLSDAHDMSSLIGHLPSKGRFLIFKRKQIKTLGHWDKCTYIYDFITFCLSQTCPKPVPKLRFCPKVCHKFEALMTFHCNTCFPMSCHRRKFPHAIDIPTNGLDLLAFAPPLICHTSPCPSASQPFRACFLRTSHITSAYR